MMIVQGCLVIYIKRLSNDLQVTSAKVHIAMALVNSNLPFAAADTFNPLFKSIFPDSEIAKAYFSGRTETTCIINGALKPYFR